VLDPLVEVFSHFTDNNDLTNQISTTFALIDEDGSGGLNFAEFKEKVKDLPTPVPIHLQKDDFDLITSGGELLNDEGEFDGQQFQLMMRGELVRFAQRQMSFALQETESKEFKAIMLMLKLMETILSSTDIKMKSLDRRTQHMEAEVEEEIRLQHDRIELFRKADADESGVR
jgi:hypothetical protein